MPFGMMSGLGSRNSVLPGDNDLKREMGNFEGKHVPDKPNNPMNCELDWFLQRRAHDRGICLIASVGRVYYRPRRGEWNCRSRAKSDIYDCLLSACNITRHFCIANFEGEMVKIKTQILKKNAEMSPKLPATCTKNKSSTII